MWRMGIRRDSARQMTGATRGAGGTVTNHLERVSPPQPTHPLIPPLSLNTIRIMFTAALRTASRSVAPRAGFRMAAASPAASLRPILLARGYASAGLSRDDITARVLDVLKTFEKVDGGKVGCALPVGSAWSAWVGEVGWGGYAAEGSSGWEAGRSGRS